MKDENQGAQNAGFPLTNLPLGDFDPSSLQVLWTLASNFYYLLFHGEICIFIGGWI